MARQLPDLQALSGLVQKAVTSGRASQPTAYFLSPTGDYKLNYKAQAAERTADGIGRNYVGPRRPFLFSTYARLYSSKEPQPYLLSFLNPRSMQYSGVGIRGAVTQTRSGVVIDYWPNVARDGTLLTNYSIQLEIDTGSTLSVSSGAGFNSTVPEGLGQFYTLASWIDEPKIVPETSDTLAAGIAGKPNYLIIAANTPGFPSLTILGMLDPSSPINFGETADDPNHITYSMTLIVVDTYPRITDAAGLRSQFDLLFAPQPTARQVTTPAGNPSTAAQPKPTAGSPLNRLLASEAELGVRPRG